MEEIKMDNKMKGGMIDNRKVNDNHQEGIARVIQRKGEAGRVGQHGKMGLGDKAEWKRPDNAATPRKA
jgi:hypothetical protein